jgi:hypothetical protein
VAFLLAVGFQEQIDDMIHAHHGREHHAQQMGIVPLQCGKALGYRALDRF